MKRDFSRERLRMLRVMVLVVGGSLFLKLFEMQILQGRRYRLAADENRTEVIFQTAPRGIIYDRNGTPLAVNKPVFSLIYVPSKAAGAGNLRDLARELGSMIRGNPADILDLLERAQQEGTALRISENLPTSVMFRLSELKPFYPGIDLVMEARRYYPLGHFAAHLLGYMGKIDPGEWANLKKEGYRIDSRVGRLGLESIFEDELRGRDGAVRMEVDAQGRIKRILDRIPWIPGHNVRLTIDARVQRAADEGLRRSSSGKGAVVALNPADGAILAFSSAPDFDPNELLSQDAFSAPAANLPLVIPEFDRAISGLYAPGSTFKTVVSVAGLESGRLNIAETIFCPGYFDLGKKRFLCWKRQGHRRVSFLRAFAESCDVYFYHMGLQIGADVIEDYETRFQLGEKTHVALRGEKAGEVFGPAANAKAFRPWYNGDTVNLAIGQGRLLVTPIRMAVLAAALANHGTLWRPHYTLSVDYGPGELPYRQMPQRMGFVNASDRTWNLIDEAMSLTVASGTARGAFIPGLDIRGKTGTAQNPLGKDHAWFIAFAGRPGRPPSIALAVLVENGGHGASAAVPIARQVIEAAFRIGRPGNGPVLPETLPDLRAPLRALPGRLGWRSPRRRTASGKKGRYHLYLPGDLKTAAA